MKKYRENGAVGALLDEYERALEDLKKVIGGISPEELLTVVDDKTADKNCRSIQTILTHVVRAGNNYAMAVRKHRGEEVSWYPEIQYGHTADYQKALDEMFRTNEKLFADYPDMVLEEYDPSKKILTRWGQVYDVEQLFEHAIVHVLRHRRQIERFLLRLRDH
jgi:uncharacterized damage-inducible protein DinB